MTDLIIESIDTNTAREITRAQVDAKSRYVYDIAVVVRNNSSRDTQYVTSALHGIEYDAVTRVLALSLVELPLPPLVDVTQIFRRPPAVHCMMVSPGRTVTIRVAVPSQINVVDATASGRGLGLHVTPVDVTELKAIRLTLGYSISPFYPRPGETHAERSDRVRQWASTVTREVKMTLNPPMTARK